MSIWNKTVKDNNIRYRFHNPKLKGIDAWRFVKAADVPPVIKHRLDAGETDVDDTGLNLDAPDKSCLFCGEQSKLTRLLDGKTVYLCDDDYYGKNLGQIAQKLKEVPQPV